MALVTELELPAFDYTDPSLRGSAFTRRWRELRPRAGWPRALRLRRPRPEVGRVLPAHPRGDLPGHEDRRDLRSDRGAAYRADAANILHVNGPDHSRLRSCKPVALAPGGRALPPGMRAFLEGLLEDPRRRAGGRRRDHLRFRGGLRQAVPLADDRHGDGRAARGRPASAPLVEPDPEAVRRGQHGDRKGEDRAGGEEFYDYARRSCRPPPLPRGRPDLEADRGRTGGREALRRRVHQPRLQHPRRWRRHDPEPARTFGPPARRKPRAVGALRADRSSPAAAVEESLRYEPITPFTARILPRRSSTAT